MAKALRRDGPAKLPTCELALADGDKLEIVFVPIKSNDHVRQADGSFCCSNSACFWGVCSPPGTMLATMRMLNDNCMPLVLDLDDTVVLAYNEDGLNRMYREVCHVTIEGLRHSA